MQKVKIPQKVDPRYTAAKRLDYVGIIPKEKLERLQGIVEEIVEDDSHCAQANEDANATQEPRDFYAIWNDVVDTIGEMNRTRRRNLGKLIYPATKKEK